jgi:Ca2+-binding EF-hand superfamily protein
MQLMAEKGPHGANFEADRDAVFAQADADSSGALSPDELKTFKSLMRDKRQARMFKHLDANGDGAVSLDELKAAPHGGHHGPHCDK